MSGIVKVIDKRTRSLENPNTPLSDPDDWAFDTLGAQRTASGVRVNRAQSLQYHAVWRAVNMVSSDVARMPLFVYERTNQGKQRAPEHPAYPLLRDLFMEGVTAFNGIQTLVAHRMLHGNAYAYIVREGGVPVALVPLNPESTYPVRENGRLFYYVEFEDKDTTPVTIPAMDVLHIHGMSWDGLCGLGLLQHARETFGLGIAGTRFQSSFFKNSGRPSAVLEHPGNLSEPAAARLRKNFNSVYTGVDNAHKTALLEEGMQLKPFAVNPKDGQVLELLRDNVRAVANFFNIPPHKLGDDSRTSHNSLESEGQSYLDSIDPIACEFEQEVREKLFTEDEKRADTHFAEFERKALIRVDTATLSEFYNKALAGAPFLTINEVRDMHNLNKLDGYDTIMMPTNNFGDDDDTVPPTDGQPDNTSNDDTRERVNSRVRDAVLDNWSDTMARLAKRMKPTAVKLVGQVAEGMQYRADVEDAHRNAICSQLDPIARTLAAIDGSSADELVQKWGKDLMRHVWGIARQVQDLPLGQRGKAFEKLWQDWSATQEKKAE